MFILDNEQPAEATSLLQFLRGWWARLETYLRRRSGSEGQPNDEPNGQDRSGGLIL